MHTKLLVVAPLLWLLGSVPLAMGQTSNQKGTSGAAASGASGTQKDANPRNDAKTIEELQLAAQRLRDAIQAMAQAPAGEKRNQAIKDGNQALMEVNRAMVNLPPDLLTAAATETNYQKAMDRLKQSAQRLRIAAQALAQEPAGKRRNETIKKINQALLETQQVMIDIPISASRK